VDPTRIRMRHLILILLAAVLTAALLRHTLHVEGGIPESRSWRPLWSFLPSARSLPLLQPILLRDERQITNSDRAGYLRDEARLGKRSIRC
jgi:hypothetical protein